MMGQCQLPLFPVGSTLITHDLFFEKRSGTINSQFHINGYVKQSDIVKAFGVTKISVKRRVALYRKKGVKGFYQPRKTRGAAILTLPVLTTIQHLLDEDLSLKDIANQLDLKQDTLAKAVKAGK